MHEFTGDPAANFTNLAFFLFLNDITLISLYDVIINCFSGILVYLKGIELSSILKIVYEQNRVL